MHFLLEPARELGGDLCDFLFGDADTLWVGLGDVSGKGVAAAIFMARTWSVLRSLAGRAPRAALEESDPGRVLMAVNRELCKANEKSMFCSVFLARLELRTGVLEYANAGHLPPYLLRANGTVEVIASRPAMPVGAMPDTVYAARSLDAGDRATGCSCIPTASPRPRTLRACSTARRGSSRTLSELGAHARPRASRHGARPRARALRGRPADRRHRGADAALESAANRSRRESCRRACRRRAPARRAAASSTESALRRRARLPR